MNYRKKYKQHYNIDFGKEYVIHHIDENRDNNDIMNLLLLPNKLHSKYHTYKSQYEMASSNGLCLDLNYSSNMCRDWQMRELEKLLEVIKEIQIWVIRKHNEDNGYIGYGHENITYSMFR